MDTRIVDNTDARRFELWSGEERIGVADYSISGGVMTMPHTVVDPAHGGRGHGGTLVKGALDSARDQGLKVRPLCSFVADYIQRNPTYADLVA